MFSASCLLLYLPRFLIRIMELKKHVDFDNLEIAFSSKSNKALRKKRFIFSTMRGGVVVKLGTSLTKIALKTGMPVKGLIKRTIFDLFCGGENIDDCQRTVDEMAKFHVGAILDYSVEGEKTGTGFESTTRELIRTIERAGKAKNIPFGAFKVTGLGAFDLLAKVQSKTQLTEDETSAFQRVRERVDRICAKAYELKVKVLIDAEESWIQGPIDALAYEMMEKYNRESVLIYNTYQLYRHDILSKLKEAFNEAKTKGYYLGAKLVRGAYMEKERERALAMGYECPIQPDKEATDTDFDEALSVCMQHLENGALFCGSHNEESNYHLTLLLEEHHLPKNDGRVHFAQLYGMSDHISYNLAAAGYNVAKYVPYGPIKSAMPYLFRRAEENTSVKGQSGRELTLINREIKRRKTLA